MRRGRSRGALKYDTQSHKPSLAIYEKSPGKTRISIMLDASLISALDERGKHPSKQIGQDLRRYYRLLAEGRLAPYKIFHGKTFPDSRSL